MPIHDWTRVDAGIFHDFHLEWISRIKAALNSGILPPEYYALAEQQVGRVEPDVLTLRGLHGPGDHPDRPADLTNGPATALAPPRTTLRAHEPEPYPIRKQRVVAVRHVSGDDVVAIVEIVSPGNKDSTRALRSFVEKAHWLLDRKIHLLIADLHPPTSRDPKGIHGAIWADISPEPFEPPPGKALTLVSYEADTVHGLKAYIEPIAVGDALPEMPLFLRPEFYVQVPLDRTYREAFEAVPRRWRAVLDPT